MRKKFFKKPSLKLENENNENFMRAKKKKRNRFVITIKCGMKNKYKILRVVSKCNHNNVCKEIISPSLSQ